MKIYWYAPFNNAHEADLAAAARREGDELTFHTRVTNPRRAGPVTVPGCDVRRDLPETPGDDGQSRSLARRVSVAVRRARCRDSAISRGGFDVAHLHTYNLFTDPLSLRRLRRRVGQLVVSIHNVRPHDRRISSMGEDRLLAAGYQVPSMLVVAHPSLRALLIEDFGVDPGRVEVIPLPVMSQGVQSTAPVPGTFLFFGTLRANKGLGIVLGAMERVKDPSIRLHVAGRGDPELEELVRAAAADDSRITAEIGYVSPERRAALFSSTSGVLLPYTDFAAQSGVLGDAWSFARPVIASNVGALGAEVVQSGTGRVVVPGDPSSLAQAMSAWDVNGAEWQRFASATERAARQRTAASLGPRIRALYDRQVD